MIRKCSCRGSKDCKGSCYYFINFDEDSLGKDRISTKRKRGSRSILDTPVEEREFLSFEQRLKNANKTIGDLTRGREAETERLEFGKNPASRSKKSKRVGSILGMTDSRVLKHSTKLQKRRKRKRKHR
jgi:hypothetical protein